MRRHDLIDGRPVGDPGGGGAHVAACRGDQSTVHVHGIRHVPARIQHFPDHPFLLENGETGWSRPNIRQTALQLLGRAGGNTLRTHVGRDLLITNAAGVPLIGLREGQRRRGFAIILLAIN